MPKYFIYARKSTDSEDRQVLSIESQTNELQEFAKKVSEVTEFNLHNEAKNSLIILLKNKKSKKTFLFKKK